MTVFGSLNRALFGSSNGIILRRIHSAAHYRSGALRKKPEEMSFAFGRVVFTVVPGLFIGAAISKNVANFLEENDLFVPDDDDDDDGDD